MKAKKTPLIFSILFSIVLLAVVVGVVSFVYMQLQKEKKADTAAPQPQTTQQETQPAALAFDKKRYSVDDPTSLWVVVNKKRPLPATFVPAGLVGAPGAQMLPEANNAYTKMIQAANSNQVSLRAISGYRSYNEQASVYQNYVLTDGQLNADTYSARPGYSEHQTGLTVDVGNGSGQCDLDVCFSSTAGGKWVAENAHTYGFIIRYAQGKTSVTGYQNEPWHLRYVGVDLANELRANGNTTMEEFFGISPAPGY